MAVPSIRTVLRAGAERAGRRDPDHRQLRAVPAQAIVGPKGLPPAVKRKVHEMSVAAMQDPAVVKRLTDLGIKIVANSPEEFTAFQAREYDRWKSLIEVRKIKAD